MQDADKIERLKEQVHRLSVAKTEVEDEVAILRAVVAERNARLRALLEASARFATAAKELVGAND